MRPTVRPTFARTHAARSPAVTLHTGQDRTYTEQGLRRLHMETGMSVCDLYAAQVTK